MNLLSIVVGYTRSLNHTPPPPPSQVMTRRFEKPSWIRMWAAIRPTGPAPIIAVGSFWKLVTLGGGSGVDLGT